MRAPITADHSNNGVTPLSQERPDLVGRCHPVTLPGGRLMRPHPVSGIERRSLCPRGCMVMAYRRVTRTAEPCIFVPVLAWLGSSSGSIRLAGWKT